MKRNTNSFWKRIRFKYKFSFFNESMLEEVWSFRMSQLTVIIYISLFAFFLIAVTSVIIILTPIRNYLPGYLDVEIRQEILQNALRADSLEIKMAIQSRYLENLTDILSGNVSIDSLNYNVSMSYMQASYDIPRGEKEAEFIRQFEEDEKYNLTALNPNPIMTDIFFFKPLNGIVSATFSDINSHFGIDLTSAPKENVVATLDGTIVYTGFDPNYGNVLAIQHKNEFLSIYKHCDVLLKETGARVVAGEAIAIVGNTGQLSTGLHLHFELWHKGAPVNPEDYIAF